MLTSFFIRPLSASPVVTRLTKVAEAWSPTVDPCGSSDSGTARSAAAVPDPTGSRQALQTTRPACRPERAWLPGLNCVHWSLARFRETAPALLVVDRALVMLDGGNNGSCFCDIARRFLIVAVVTATFAITLWACCTAASACATISSASTAFLPVWR